MHGLVRAALAAALFVGAASEAHAQPVRRVDPDMPPTAKPLIRATLRLQAEPLARGSHCNGVGAERGDVDIGDYQSCFAAELVDGGRDWIETGAVRVADPRSRAAVWRARVVIRRVHEEDRIGWGVQFDLRARDLSLVPGSIVCIGAG